MADELYNEMSNQLKENGFELYNPNLWKLESSTFWFKLQETGERTMYVDQMHNQGLEQVGVIVFSPMHYIDEGRTKLPVLGIAIAGTNPVLDTQEGLQIRSQALSGGESYSFGIDHLPDNRTYQHLAANIRETAGISLTDQLTQMGFVEDPNNTNLYRAILSNKYGKRDEYEVIVILENGYIRHILKSVSPQVKEIAGTNSRIVKIQRSKQNKGFYHIAFQGNNGEILTVYGSSGTVGVATEEEMSKHKTSLETI